MTPGALALALGSCYAGAPEEPPTASQAQALNGTITWNTAPGSVCDPATERPRIQAAMNRLVAQVLTNPAPLRDCLRDSFTTNAHGAFAEQIMAALAANVPTQFSCQDSSVVPCGGAFFWGGCASIGIAGEALALNHGDVTSRTTASLAALSLHELGHNKGFDHIGPSVDYNHSVNEQLQACSGSIGAANPAGTPYGLRRSAMVGEAELQQMGGAGGLPFAHFCPAGQTVAGAALTGSPVVGPNGNAVELNGITTWCRPLAGVALTTIGPAGGPGGGVNLTRLCPVGHVAIGINGRAGATVEQFSFVCAPLVDVQAGTIAATTTLTTAGGPTAVALADFVERRCPPRMAVRAVLGRAGAVIDQLRLVCEDVTVAAIDPPVPIAAFGGIAAGTQPGATQGYCSDTAAIAGLYLRVGPMTTPATTTIERLGAVCIGLDRSGATVAHRVGAQPHPIPANGRSVEGASRAATIECPNSNQRVVGIRAGTDPITGAISYVTVACAAVGAWTGPTAMVPYELPTGEGTDYGNAATHLCPRLEFVVGLEVRSEVIGTPPADRRQVERIVPFCRRFD